MIEHLDREMSAVHKALETQLIRIAQIQQQLDESYERGLAQKADRTRHDRRRLLPRSRLDQADVADEAKSVTRQSPTNPALDARSR